MNLIKTSWPYLLNFRRRIPAVMNFVLLFSCLCSFNAFASVYSQEKKLSLDVKSQTIKDILYQIENQSDFRFIYEAGKINLDKKISLHVKEQSVEAILKLIFGQEKVRYEITENNFILINPSGTAKKSMAQSGTSAPKKKITGLVTDVNGEPIIGANVVEKGTTNGIITDIDGKFTLEVALDAVIQISYIGYHMKEVKVEGKSTISVQLAENTETLDEVVVVAYGTAKKKDLTGAVSALDSKIMQAQSVSSVTNLLEGAAPGLQVSQVDGQPGLDMGIRVRGLGSASADNSNALIVIDGVPCDYANALSSVNPKDVANITVLKDAASTALYGSRGANGVVLVTTNKGASGKTKISFEGRWGITQVGPAQYKNMTNAKDMYEFAWQAVYNSARYGNENGVSENYSNRVANPNMSHDAAALFASQHLFDYSSSLTAFQRNDLGNWMLYSVPGAEYLPTGSGAYASSTMSGAYLVNPDGRLNPDARQLFDAGEYKSELLNNAFRQEYTVSANGGTDKTQYYISLGYLDNPSFIVGSAFDRYNVRTSIDSDLTKWLKVGAKMAYAYRKTRTQATRYGRNPGNSQQNVFRYINNQLSLVPLFARDKDGNIIRDKNGDKVVHTTEGDSYSPLGMTGTGVYPGNNIMQIMDMDMDQTVSNDISFDGYFTVKLTKDLSFTNNFSLKKYFDNRTRYMNSLTGQVKGEGVYGKVNEQSGYLTSQQLLNYGHDFGLHHVDALLGHEYNAYDLDLLTYRSSDELIPGFVTFNNFVGHYQGGTYSNPGGGKDKTRMEGYLFRANYNYNEKYYLSTSVRRDGSSKFKYSKNRWGTFWSVGGSWRVTSEEFMKPTSGWLDNLKVRASYGVIGNQNGVSNYSGYQTWSYGAVYGTSSNGTGDPVGYKLSKNNYVNENLTWEKVHTFDAGIDFSLFNRLHGSLDYYNKNTVNAIWSQPIANSKGQSSIISNSAAIRNRGVEIDLTYDIMQKKDLFWSFSVNGSKFSTVLTKVPNGVGSAALDGNWTATSSERWGKTGAYGQGEICYLRGIDKPYYNMYLYEYGGVAGNTGKEYYYDGQKYTGVSGDPARGMALYGVKVTEDNKSLYPGASVGDKVYTTDYSQASRFEQGDALPKLSGGFSTYLQYKGFDLTAAFAYQIGGKFFGYEYGSGFYISEDWTGSGLSDELIGNTWTEENPDAKFPMVMYKDTKANGSTFGDRLYTDMALFNASYLNVKNITLGYNLPKHLYTKYNVSNLRVFVTGNNLFMFTSHSGIDPRMSLTGGMDIGPGTYPYARTFSIGINIDL